MSSREKVLELIELADIGIDGTRPEDIRVHDDRFYRRVLAQGALGLGESYMDGWWDCEAIDAMIDRLIRADLQNRVSGMQFLLNILAARVLNLQSRRRAWQVGKRHYDLGNDLYRSMLDENLNYSCGYWKNARNLNKAQEAKVDLCCRKLGLQPGMHVLDIGCGWGGFARHAARNYGVRVTGLTVSFEQVEYFRNHSDGLPITAELQDYRLHSGTYDAIVSIGMVEHVGSRNYREFMRVARRCLKDDGLFLLHTIGSPVSEIVTDPWTARYIFPNGMLPSIRQLSEACEGLFIIEDLHNFSADYDRTLMAWFENFANHWPTLRERYGDRFYRMWKYYLLSSAGGFRSRKNQLWQIVLSPKGVRGGYRSIR